jgi:hypothetical protein
MKLMMCFDLLQIRQEKPYYIADPEVDSLVSGGLHSFFDSRPRPLATGTVIVAYCVYQRHTKVSQRGIRRLRSSAQRQGDHGTGMGGKPFIANGS